MACCRGVIRHTSPIVKVNLFLQICSHIFYIPSNSICWQRNMLSLSPDSGKRNKYFPVTCTLRTPTGSVSSSSLGMAFHWFSFRSPMTSSSLFGSFSSTVKHPQVCPILKTCIITPSRSCPLSYHSQPSLATFIRTYLYVFTARVFLSPLSLALGPHHCAYPILTKIPS